MYNIDIRYRYSWVTHAYIYINLYGINTTRIKIYGKTLTLFKVRFGKVSNASFIEHFIAKEPHTKPNSKVRIQKHASLFSLFITFNPPIRSTKLTFWHQNWRAPSYVLFLSAQLCLRLPRLHAGGGCGCLLV